ncbi:MAG: cytochrome c [Planctomycetota bacterium]|nr:MAG: cytochrome c [Planctomycetota bacterium]
MAPPPEAVFAPDERIDDLVRQARRPVVEMVTERFGTPNRLVAWEALPVDYGVLEGRVVEAYPETDGTCWRLKVELDAVPEFPKDWPAPLLQGVAVAFLSFGGKPVSAGGLVDEGENRVGLTVQRFDPGTGVLELAQRLGSPPSAGDRLRLVGHKLQRGRVAYMRHCVHCHGVAGDGNGPTAPYLNPRPRDYRRGIFKFTSTGPNERPTRDDLKRTIRQGIPGTYMPSFFLLDDGDVEAIVEYVRFLAMRGEFERRLVDELILDYSTEAVAQRVDAGEERSDILDELETFLRDELPETAAFEVERIANAWRRVERPEALVVPKTPRTPDTFESRARGRKLFLSKTLKCVDCHGPTGRGDGPMTEDYQLNTATNEYYPFPGLVDAWGHPIRPRNLTRGIYRGGRRPLDIYRRIYVGIKGTPMPSSAAALNEEQIWDLVNYVLSIPYETADTRRQLDAVAAQLTASEK